MNVIFTQNEMNFNNIELKYLLLIIQTTTKKGAIQNSDTILGAFYSDIEETIKTDTWQLLRNNDTERNLTKLNLLLLKSCHERKD